MLDSAKIDEFYQRIKSIFYPVYPISGPTNIIIISPNHFNRKSTIPQTICETGTMLFHDKPYILSPFPNTSCEEKIFYSHGNIITTQEHGIGEQLQRIQKYFPNTKNIFPIILPTHYRPDISL